MRLSSSPNLRVLVKVMSFSLAVTLYLKWRMRVELERSFVKVQAVISHSENLNVVDSSNFYQLMSQGNPDLEPREVFIVKNPILQ